MYECHKDFYKNKQVHIHFKVYGPLAQSPSVFPAFHSDGMSPLRSFHARIVDMFLKTPIPDPYEPTCRGRCRSLAMVIVHVVTQPTLLVLRHDVGPTQVHLNTRGSRSQFKVLAFGH